MCFLSLLSLPLFLYFLDCEGNISITLDVITVDQSDPSAALPLLFALSFLALSLSLPLPLLSVCQSPSLLHLYISIIPCSLETDEGAGQAVNVFFFPFVCIFLFLPPTIGPSHQSSHSSVISCNVCLFLRGCCSHSPVICSISCSLSAYLNCSISLLFHGWFLESTAVI